jgi:hypothetical protein
VNGVQILFILDFFQFFYLKYSKMIKFVFNGRIHIQMIKFKFTRINQELTTYYRPPTPMTNGSADGTARPHATTRPDSSAGGIVRFK